jgi:hypothetical protein
VQKQFVVGTRSTVWEIRDCLLHLFPFGIKRSGKNSALGWGLVIDVSTTSKSSSGLFTASIAVECQRGTQRDWRCMRSLWLAPDPPYGPSGGCFLQLLLAGIQITGKNSALGWGLLIDISTSSKYHSELFTESVAV